jgi:hypothetical protein
MVNPKARHGTKLSNQVQRTIQEYRFDTHSGILRSARLEMPKDLREPRASRQMQQEKALTVRIVPFFTRTLDSIV